ncbi:NAD-dependent epimerase/dehydratase family protein [Agrococcus sediminis]|uniref:NAD-dependent epimerase/dehydratase family protein n=1 Tax=Agrococcus sediminis TaxID=2599924 RepID=UPI00381EF141
MQRIVITGGAGFLGVPTALALRAMGHEVTVLDAKGDPRLADAGITTRVGSILDGAFVREILAEARPDIIIHAAAVVGVAASLGGVARSVEVNVLGSVTVFEAACELGLSRFVDISSEETYGDFAEEPIGEDAPALPKSPYGITKFTVERLGAFYAEHRGLPYVAVRFCWVYGPDFPRARVPQQWIEDALAGRSSVEPHGAEQRIDFTYVDDAVAGLLAIVSAEHLEHRAYNIATGVAHPLERVAEAVRLEFPGWSLQIGDGLVEMAPGVRAARKGAMSIDRAAELGYRPTVDLDEGIRRTIESCRTSAAAHERNRS